MNLAAEDFQEHGDQAFRQTWILPFLVCGQPILTLFCGVSEDAADLESIELVASLVLDMQMPTTPAQLQNLTDEIRQKVVELGDVETILQQSAEDIQRAENLLDQARQARLVTAVNPRLGMGIVKNLAISIPLSILLIDSVPYRFSYRFLSSYI